MVWVRGEMETRLCVGAWFRGVGLFSEINLVGRSDQVIQNKKKFTEDIDYNIKILANVTPNSVSQSE